MHQGKCASTIQKQKYTTRIKRLSLVNHNDPTLQVYLKWMKQSYTLHYFPDKKTKTFHLDIGVEKVQANCCMFIL